MVRILIVISSFFQLWLLLLQDVRTKLRSIWSCHWTLPNISFMHLYLALSFFFSVYLPLSLHTNNYCSPNIALILCMFHCAASSGLPVCTSRKINDGRNFMKNKIQRCAKIWKEAHQPLHISNVLWQFSEFYVEIEWLKVWFLAGFGAIQFIFYVCLWERVFVGTQNTKQHTTKTWCIDVVVFRCWKSHKILGLCSCEGAPK